MITAGTRRAFESMAISGTGDAGALAMGLRREVTNLGLRALAAKALHVAVAAPERMIDIYDNASAGWLSGPTFPPRLRTGEALTIPSAFWTAFWDLQNLPSTARREPGFTQKMLQLAGRTSAQLNARVAAAATDFPGVSDAAATGATDPFGLAELADCSPATLGGIFYQDVMRRGGVLEPYGRDVLRLSDLPPPLDYVNTRVLQCQAVWSIVAGYGPSTLDQIAMAAFQMGQFGHNYSALYVAVVLSTVSIERPPALEIVLDSIFKGWTHGRQSPSLLGAPWESLWRLSLDEVRAQLGITPFDSPYSAAIRQLGGNGKRPPRA